LGAESHQLGQLPFCSLSGAIRVRPPGDRNAGASWPASPRHLLALIFSHQTLAGAEAPALTRAGAELNLPIKQLLRAFPDSTHCFGGRLGAGQASGLARPSLHALHVMRARRGLAHQCG
jgi:hypothetical protein